LQKASFSAEFVRILFANTRKIAQKNVSIVIKTELLFVFELLLRGKIQMNDAVCFALFADKSFLFAFT